MITQTRNVISLNHTNLIGQPQVILNRRPSHLCRLYLLAVLAIASLALSPSAHSTCEQGCDTTNENTFLGDGALLNNTTGVGNTAVGSSALGANTDGADNTAVGDDALLTNTEGMDNTAFGAGTLEFNATGLSNSAFGEGALTSNITGNSNTAVGMSALLNNVADNNTATGAGSLRFNTSGTNNTADGDDALATNTTGSNNVANGVNALLSNTTGSFNAVNGVGALKVNTTGNNNTVDGYRALFSNTTGSNNIAIGASAGTNLTTGSNNIDVGALGLPGEANTIRLGKKGTQTNAYIAGISGVTVAGGVGVIIDTNGHLGTIVSSKRFKEDIQPMDRASKAILSLQPVTFRYKKDLDPRAIPQFGLVAEQVEKVDPDLVARDDQGKPYSVRYEAVNAMLLNEFLKEHRRVQEQSDEIATQKATITQLQTDLAQQEKHLAQQQGEIAALTTSLQKVSNELELIGPRPRMMASDR